VPALGHSGAALILLAGAVSISMIPPPLGRDAMTSVECRSLIDVNRIISMAEIHPSFASEAIIIRHSTVNIYLSASEITENNGVTSLSHYGSRSDDIIPLQFFKNIRSSPIYVGVKLSVDGPFDLCRRKIAAIFNAYQTARLPRCDAQKWLYPHGFDTQVSALESPHIAELASYQSRSFTHDVSLHSISAPLEPSNHSQGGSEEAAVILANELPCTDVIQRQAGARPYDRADENVDTFVKILVLFAVLALLNAIGKRFGLLDDERASKDDDDRGDHNPKGPTP